MSGNRLFIWSSKPDLSSLELSYRVNPDCKNQTFPAPGKQQGGHANDLRTMAWSSSKLFCMGVPESIIRRGVFRAPNI